MKLTKLYGLWPRPYWLIGIFIILFTCLMVFVEIKNGKFWTNDLKVYYGAIFDFHTGNSPYLRPYGLSSGFFKYPPPTILFFSLFKVFSFFQSQIIHTAFSCFCFVASIFLIHKYVLGKINQASEKKYYGILWLSFLFVAIHVVREIHLGNINLILLLFTVLGMVLIQNRPFFSAFLWSMVILFKPFMLLAFIPLIFFNQKRIILYVIGFGILYLVASLIFLGSNGFNLWEQWFQATIQHSEYQVNYDSIGTLSDFYIGIHSEWIPSLIVLLILIISLVLDRKSKTMLNLIDWMAVFLAFTPSFFKTDTQHFMFSLPLILLLVKELIKVSNIYLWLIFIFLVAGFSLNSNDLLGKELGHWVSQCGFLGISNLLIILFFYVLKKFFKENYVETSHLV